MRPPCESVVRTFLKVFRLVAIRKLRERGLTQEEVARLLGLTQASVSQQLGRPFPPQDPVENNLARLVESDASELVEVLLGAKDASSPETHRNALRVACATCRRLRSVGGFACARHRDEFEDLRRVGCRVCSEGAPEVDSARTDERKRVVDALVAAADALTADPNFPPLIPEVATNLVCSTSAPRGIEDVAGFPGRIVKVRDQARVLADPEFGASKFLSRVLLGVRSRFPDKRCCACLRYDADVESSLEELDVRVIKLSFPEDQPMDMERRVRELLEAENPPALDVLVNLGGRGTESISYVFGGDPAGLVDLVASIGEAFRRRRRRDAFQ
ncbi:MAG: thiamine-phosphate synthase family protein [Promethearchaeota archaeon]